MDAAKRQALLHRMEALRTEIVIAERDLEGASTDLYGPRIRDLEEQLEDTQRILVEMRRSIAESGRRWQRWPVGWIAALVFVAFVLVEWR